MQNPQSWQWPPRPLLPHRQGDLMGSCHSFIWLASTKSSVPLQALIICRICADLGQKTSTRNYAKNIALAPVMVIWRIKAMCGQVISVKYPNKENHDRQKDETDSKDMMIFARPPGSGYPNQLKVIIPYGSTKAYSQQPTLFYKDFISR